MAGNMFEGVWRGAGLRNAFEAHKVGSEKEIGEKAWFLQVGDLVAGGAFDVLGYRPCDYKVLVRLARGMAAELGGTTANNPPDWEDWALALEIGRARA